MVHEVTEELFLHNLILKMLFTLLKLFKCILSENVVVCVNVMFMIVLHEGTKVEKHRRRQLLHARGCLTSNGTGGALQQSRLRKYVSLQPEM